MTTLTLEHPELWRTQHFIGGEWVGGAATYDVLDPASGEPIAQVARGGRDEAQRAIDAASTAFPSWRTCTAAERGAKVRR
jgi:succinate-semialdehyde dehydrogenase/glutarate-semialdehyde dehydrogenase